MLSVSLLPLDPCSMVLQLSEALLGEGKGGEEEEDGWLVGLLGWLGCLSLQIWNCVDPRLWQLETAARDVKTFEQAKKQRK